MLSWYVFRTKVSQEELAMQGLTEQGFNAYLPTFEKMAKHARKEVVREYPLFPSYLFCQLDLDYSRWGRALHTRGIAEILGAPTPLRDTVVEVIRGRLTGGFKPGDAVRIDWGAWRGVEGVFASSHRERVRVMLSLLGRDVIKDFHRSQVVKAI